ncbi:Nuclear poly(A) polymerase 3 [Camellia lanceoleosa]|uniref:Nuclear poly(A) polymerase 3 n=1 Tax=Camellia lanceoleosa TaxID=1840588 RepID=A0ACC0GXF2_9ERIC|nr:Nuclear poly(A) polymerase 3 [Camellia lanceoleosa]
MLTRKPEVSEVHCITNAKVPLMRFKLDVISIDLPYAQLKVMYVPENVDILNSFFLSDIDETNCRSLSGVHANKCILRLLPSMEVSSMLSMGSYESDIDALCVGPCFATLIEDFFLVLHSMLTSRPEVSEVHCVTDAKVPLMRFKLDGISIDLPYAQLKVMSVPENVDILNPFFLSNIDETSWRSLSGVHANKCILRLLPNMEVFKPLLRCVKLWAKRQGVYGNLLGFFGGVHLAILAAFICQRHPNVSLNGLISNFFKTFAFWDWRTPVILQDGMVPMTTSANEIRSLMPIRLPCRPHEYCHSNITKSTLYRIRTEFHRGHALTKTSGQAVYQQHAAFTFDDF